MANKTEKLSPHIFIDEMDAINTKAQNAAIDLLNQQGNNRYIVVMDWEDYYTEYYTYKAAISVSVFGVGLNEDNNLCIAATVDNQGYGCSEESFAQDWVETSELDIPNYANLYRFIADNIDKAVTKEEADELADKYWNRNGHDSRKYDWQDDFIRNGFVKVKLDGKFGFINEDDEEIVSCKYEYADDFYDGMAKVKSEEGWGFVNEDGEEIISCKYEYATSFSDGLARVNSEEGCGFINKDGEEIVPCKYEEVLNFSEGLAGVKSKEGWGFINKDGEEIVPCKYEEVHNFSEGLAGVKSKEGWGFINKDGEEIIPCKYEDIFGFWNRNKTARVRLNGEWITIDTTGKQVTE